jgi:hypothetical protein
LPLVQLPLVLLVVVLLQGPVPEMTLLLGRQIALQHLLLPLLLLLRCWARL